MAKEDSWAKGYGKKTTYRQSYADAVRSKHSNGEGMKLNSQTSRSGSQRPDHAFSDLRAIKFLALFDGEQVQINDDDRSIAEPDRLSVPMESDGADLGKRMEERVEKVNLINSVSSLQGGHNLW
ncbi:hypothetical protein Ancab_035557 [Ancistrocladus abbreviatus]